MAESIRRPESIAPMEPMRIQPVREPPKRSQQERRSPPRQPHSDDAPPDEEPHQLDVEV